MENDEVADSSAGSVGRQYLPITTVSTSNLPSLSVWIKMSVGRIIAHRDMFCAASTSAGIGTSAVPRRRAQDQSSYPGLYGWRKAFAVRLGKDPHATGI
jgi:hypothetical protein